MNHIQSHNKLATKEQSSRIVHLECHFIRIDFVFACRVLFLMGSTEMYNTQLINRCQNIIT